MLMMMVAQALTFEGLKLAEVDIDAIDELGGRSERLFALVLMVGGGGGDGDLLSLVHLVRHVDRLVRLRLDDLQRKR